MEQRWRRRPEGANWGAFGPDDQLGRLNLITPERVRAAVAEVREGRRFCLSLPLDIPGGNVLNPLRHPPRLEPVQDEGDVFPLVSQNPLHTDLICDERVTLYSQYSTQWDALAHIGARFDADGDGIAEQVFYNGWSVAAPETGRPIHGRAGAAALGIEHMATFGLQGRGVMVDLRAHLGDARIAVGYDGLMRVLEADSATVEPGDLVCLHTGSADRLLSMRGHPDPAVVHGTCPVLDGGDARLLRWIDDSGMAALISDNQAVEGANMWTLRGRHGETASEGPALPLHEHCIFKLGLPLGELWYLSELAAYLRRQRRTRFLLTAPPLRLPGAAGSPVTPIATV